MGVVFYTVYYQAVSGSLKMTLGNITTTLVTVTNLSPATQYMMTVVAENGVPGDEANRSASITVTTQSVSICTLAYFFKYSFVLCSIHLFVNPLFILQFQMYTHTYIYIYIIIIIIFDI